MSKSFVTLGIINKKLLLPLFLALSQIIYIIFNKYYPVPFDNLVIQVLSMALAEMSIKLFPLILKIKDSNVSKEKEQTTKKQKIKHYAILIGLYLLNASMITGASFYDYYINNT